MCVIKLLRRDVGSSLVLEGGGGGGWGLKVRGWGKIAANTITVSLTK